MLFFLLLQIHYNSFTGYLLIAFVGVVLFAYYLFKIERYLVKHGLLVRLRKYMYWLSIALKVLVKHGSEGTG